MIKIIFNENKSPGGSFQSLAASILHRFWKLQSRNIDVSPAAQGNEILKFD